MKTQIRILVAIAMIASAACSKKQDEITPPPPGGSMDNYTSMQDFFSKNGVAMQTFTVNAVTGGSFITPQGTKVTVPANAFVTQSGSAVTGNVQIEFKDIYKKSDMLLSDMPTINHMGPPLKSAGEFFIRAKSNNIAIKLDSAKNINVEQPAVAAQDTMNAFVAFRDSAGGNGAPQIWWWPSGSNAVLNTSTSYIFSLYQFTSPVDSGSWCNSDNSYYFNSYPTTQLTCDPDDDPTQFDMEVFLVFGSVNSMVHVYNATVNNNIVFPYLYAPQGLSCTIVAVGVKDDKLYSSFKPITIGANQTVNFTISETTTEAFKAQLDALN